METQYRTESRSVELRDAEVKGRMFRGYAAVFDAGWHDNLTKVMGYVEKVSRGAFRKALSSQGPPGVPLLVAHEPKMLLATTDAGTLKLQEDGRGLLAEAELPDNYLGEYAREMIERGDFRGMSYGIEIDPRRDVLMTRSSGGVYTKTVASIQRLLDVSLTWEPAYLGTSVELRSAGFVATPLQELLGGTEVQTEDGGKDEPPDDEPEAWWDDDPNAEPPAEAPTEHKPWWETYLDHLEEVGK